MARRRRMPRRRADGTFAPKRGGSHKRPRRNPAPKKRTAKKGAARKTASVQKHLAAAATHLHACAVKMGKKGYKRAGGAKGLAAARKRKSRKRK